MEGSGYGLICGTISAFAWRTRENHEYPVRIVSLQAEI
jgi:hypothetical protein